MRCIDLACRRVGALLVTAVAILVTTAGCFGKDKALQPTETIAQATQRLDVLLQEALAQLPADVTTERAYKLDAIPCDAPTDGGPDGRIFAEHDFEIVPPASGAWSVTEVFPTLSAFWQQKGYKATTEDRIANEHRYFVQTDDGYQIFVLTYDRGDHYDVSVGASSPCVWEFGTPDPQ
ncbi:hypothetical protein [Salinispora arenicola]|uniref:hypothetical protein n=1 Tax=Salinispora arenicola TaxID=168697 RepID=UPI00035CA478|nr:hypothetical protein [Salinispora arenicola]